jgi:hypothetical protein
LLPPSLFELRRTRSSQELLAMTGRVFHYPLHVIASAREAIQRNAKELDCFVARAPRNDGESFPLSSQRHCERMRSKPAKRKRTGLLPPSLFELRRTRSSQELLAMTGRVFHYPLNVIASAATRIQTGELPPSLCELWRTQSADTVGARAARNDAESRCRMRTL